MDYKQTLKQNKEVCLFVEFFPWDTPHKWHCTILSGSYSSVLLIIRCTGGQDLWYNLIQLERQV